MRRRLTAAGTIVLAAALALPATASAHGLVGKQDLPIPRWLFAWGAALVLVISFVGLAVLWPRPRLEDVREKRVLRLPVQLEVLSGLIGIAIFGIVVYAGFAGVQTSTANLTPTARIRPTSRCEPVNRGSFCWNWRASSSSSRTPVGSRSSSCNRNRC